MNTTIITSGNAPTDTRVPAVRESRRGENLYREDRESAGSRKALPSFLVSFDGDKVSISPETRAAVQGFQEQLPVHVPPSLNQQAVVEKTARPEQVLTVKGPGSAVDGGAVRYTVNVGPYDVRVSTMAMKKYGEASSYRAGHSSTFEVTI